MTNYVIQGEKMFCDDCKRPLSVANNGTNHVISIVCPDCMTKRSKYKND